MRNGAVSFKGQRLHAQGFFSFPSCLCLQCVLHLEFEQILLHALFFEEDRTLQGRSLPHFIDHLTLFEPETRLIVSKFDQTQYILKSNYGEDLALFEGPRELLAIMTLQDQYGQLPKYNSLKWKGQREVRKAQINCQLTDPTWRPELVTVLERPVSMRDPSILCITLGKSLHFLGPTFSSVKETFCILRDFFLFHFLCFVIVYWQIIVELKSARTVDLQKHKKIFSIWYRSDEMDTPVGKTMIPRG